MTLLTRLADALDQMAAEREKVAAPSAPAPQPPMVPRTTEGERMLEALKRANVEVPRELAEKMAANPGLTGLLTKLAEQAAAPTPMGEPDERRTAAAAPRNKDEAASQAYDRFGHFLLTGERSS